MAFFRTGSLVRSRVSVVVLGLLFAARVDWSMLEHVDNDHVAMVLIFDPLFLRDDLDAILIPTVPNLCLGDIDLRGDVLGSRH